VRALLRQRLCYVWRRAELLARIESHQLAEGKTPVKQSRPNRDPWEQRLLASYEHDHPLHTTTLEIDLAMIRANAILAHKLARAVYFMLQRGTGFDVEKLVATSVGGAMKAA